VAKVVRLTQARREFLNGVCLAQLCGFLGVQLGRDVATVADVQQTGNFADQVVFMGIQVPVCIGDLPLQLGLHGAGKVARKSNADSEVSVKLACSPRGICARSYTNYSNIITLFTALDYP